MISVAQGLACTALCWLWLIVSVEIVGLAIFATWMTQ